jgi:hypothetical protein
MKTVSFTVKQKPIMNFIKWQEDEGDGSWWFEEERMESDYQLEKGDFIVLDDLKYCVHQRTYYVSEDIWCYHLDPVYRLNI